jgi:hypothetical protein
MADMNKAIDKAEIRLNQNLWVLVVSYAGLGVAEYWELHRLLCLALIMAALTSILVFVSMVFYTFHYCVKKCAQARDLRSTRTTPPPAVGR